jgi:hypothetical protein
VDSTMVQDILNHWEIGTTLNATQGIYVKNITVFGNPPDVDGDPHITIFITKLGSFNGTSFDGYFKADNQSIGDVSNLTEMVYIDCENNEPNSPYLLGVLAHEFQHMLQWNIDPMENNWLDETLAQAAMVLNGYLGDLPSANIYIQNYISTLPLIVADDSHDYPYGAGLLFASYLIDRFGESVISDIASDSERGAVSITSALSSYGSQDFWDLLLDWTITSLVNDPTFENGIYSYKTLGNQVELPTVSTREVSNNYSMSLSISSYLYVSYINLTGGNTYNIDFQTDSLDNIISKVVSFNDAGDILSVDELDLSSTPVSFQIDANATNIAISVVRTNGSGFVAVNVN